jgi:hypothetical protein
MLANEAVITVEAKVMGQRAPVVSGWRIPLLEPPSADRDNGEAMRLRDLLAHVVRQEVQAFRQRQEERRLARVLSPREIESAAASGKVAMGGPRELQATQELSDEAAIETALQAFEDGLYFVFLDGVQQHDLEAAVWPRPDSTLTFIRLVALAGG